MKILDIDLDFFLYDRATHITGTNRLNRLSYKPWSQKKVKEYLEINCNLSTANKIPGQYFTHHDEVFSYLRRLQEENNFSLKFEVDHIDAHCDLGLGDSSHYYIASEILEKSLIDRAYPDKLNGWDGLSEGNFLAFAIACRWIVNLNYINRSKWSNDIPWYLFRDFEVESNIIELKEFSKSQIRSFQDGNVRELMKSAEPINVEPPVKFQFIDFESFQNTEKYDAIFLTQSPEYTPMRSDKLIPIIKSYMSMGQVNTSNTKKGKEALALNSGSNNR